MGRIFRLESFSPTRVCAVLARFVRTMGHLDKCFSIYLFDGARGSFLGVVLVSRGDYDSAPTSPLPSPRPRPSLAHLIPLAENREPLLGDFLALLSAMFYALYVVLLKVRVGSEARINMQLFFGFVGLINICCAWVMGLLLHFTGVERFHMPGSRRQWGGVLLNVCPYFARCNALINKYSCRC
jgi:drug/metabolite transporter (DMT)-like permease